MAAGKFEEQISHLAATQPFEMVRAYLANFDEVEITETMIRETAQDCGSAFIEADEAASHKPLVMIPAPRTEILYVEADGSMVPIGPKNQENP